MKSLLKIYRGRLYERRFPILNIKRCSIAAFFLSIFIPTILLINIGILDQTLIRPEYNKYLFGILVLSVIYLFFNVISGNKNSIMHIAIPMYRVYLVNLGLFMMLLSNSFFNFEGSLFYFFVSGLFFAIVPVLSKRELVFCEALTVMFVAFLIISNIDDKSVISQVLIFNLIRLVVVVWKYNNIVRMIRLEEQLTTEREVSQRDDVTGYESVAGLDRRLGIMWRVLAGEKASCGAISVDVKKAVIRYDKYGMSSEEELIAALSKEIKSLLRNRTDIFARTGEYRFIIIIQDTDITEMKYLGRKLKLELQLADGMNVGMSIVKNTREESYKSLIKNTNNSLKYAKNINDGAVAYESSIITGGIEYV